MNPGQMPEEREEREERDLLDALAEPALVLSRDGIVQQVNRAFVTALARAGTQPEDFLGRSLDGLCGPLDESVLELLQKVGAEGDLHLRDLLVWRAGEDEGRRVDLISAPIGANRRAILVRLPFCPDHSRQEQSLRGQDRARILGLVAAGVAHDLNNQLAATMNIAALLKDELAESHGSQRALEIIEGSAREAANLARRLLRFAGRGDPSPGSEPLKEIIDRAMALIRHDLPPPERLGIAIALDLGKIRGESVQLEQLVITLLLSAAFRAGPSGLAAFEARRLTLDQERQIGSRLLCAGSYALLEVCCRRPEGGDPTLYDSLSVARGIAADHGGALKLDDDGKTLLVTVFLPVDQGPDPISPEPCGGEPEASHPARVLVVDDDAMVRDVSQAMLERLGYEAVLADGGFEALEILRSKRRPVDLILLDLVMEHMDGVSTLREIRKFLPDVPVLVSSGFGSARERHSAEELRVHGSLEKPYSLSRLKQALETVLGPRADS